MEPEWWMVWLTGGSILFSLAALALSIFSLSTARNANKIAEAQKNAAEENNRIALAANEHANEAVTISRTDRQRAHRREDELHQVRWSVGWTFDRTVNEPADLVDTRVSFLNMGPDEPYDVKVYFYRDGYLLCSDHREGHIPVTLGYSLQPAGRERCEQELREWDASDGAGLAVVLASDDPRWRRRVEEHVHDAAVGLINQPSELIIRWKSAAGVPYERSFYFPRPRGREGHVRAKAEPWVDTCVV